MLNTLTTFSVIVPALNEERYIGSCLTSLTRLRYPRGAWEVIVVDNGSTDRTVQIAQSFDCRLTLSVFQRPGVRVSAVRNFGARMAAGERLIFLDADCVVPPDWLERAVMAARMTDAVLLGARFHLPEQSSWVARVWWAHEQRPPRGPVSFLSGHNLHIDRREFLDLGGFDESLDSNEDYELSRRVVAAGMRIQECPELAVVHVANAQTLGSFFRRERWHGRDVFRVFLRDLRRRHNGRAVGFALYTWFCLLTIAAGAVSSVAFGRLSPLSVAGLAALLAAPVALAARAAAEIGRARLAPALSLLFLVYGVARSVALIDIGRAPQRKLVKVATHH